MTDSLAARLLKARTEGDLLPDLRANTQDVSVSFEFFPPKTEKMQETLWQCIHRLAPLSPSFVSVTYGAGGTTRERTHETVTRLQDEAGLKAAAHLTCVGAPQAEIDAIIDQYAEAGISHIVALRGDMPDNAPYLPHPDGYPYALDLVKAIKKRAPQMTVSVAAYPEKHPESTDMKADIDNLKRKIDAGADQAITQFFFDMDAFKRFRDHADRAGISVPIIPGILPVTNFKRVIEFAALNNTRIPPSMHALFDGLDDDPETRKLLAASFAIEQCRALLDEGIRHFHFYTLNRADLTYALCHVLGFRSSAAV